MSMLNPPSMGAVPPGAMLPVAPCVSGGRGGGTGWPIALFGRANIKMDSNRAEAKKILKFRFIRIAV